MNFTVRSSDFPLSLLSHMISFIRPMASVVLASSKKTIVSKLWALFPSANFCASVTISSMCCSVVPPCTLRVSMFLLPAEIDARSHMYRISLVFPHPVSPIMTTGILHLNLIWIARILMRLSTVRTYDGSGSTLAASPITLVSFCIIKLLWLVQVRESSSRWTLLYFSPL